ncbi:cytochrome P450 [Bailinhaonella thermotolerans]|uniref:cytochrome P450 n=1 Tax=Bailinhaonella thermotolerans TaxID=1070861 RepID=UPI00192A620A|nr:cytochrome P450 [Bailinhaonella thermotolerans]
MNLVDPDVYARDGAPHEWFARLRREDPVHRHEGDPERGWPPFWAVTRYDDVVHVSRHSELFSSHRRLALFPELPSEQIEMQRLMMLNQDPPEHTRRRALVNRGFTPRTIGRLEQHVREICHDLVDQVRERGEADFVRDIAAPLPLYVICELIGAPVSDRDLLFDLSNCLIGGDDPEYQPTPDQGRDAALAIHAYADALAAERRARPRDDLVTRLLQPDENGDVLSRDEFDLFFLLLIVAGNETTRNAASGGMLAFFDHPAQWERLLADRSLLPGAADEIVRWVTPVNLFRRTATRDTVLRDVKIAENDKVVVFYASANRDEAVFRDPGAFDIGRDPNPQIGFGGGGAHFCLGNHLAKLELRVLFEVIAEKLPGIRQTGPARRLRSNFINGLKELPVAF